MTKISYSRHHFATQYTFKSAADILRLDFITDKSQGFKVPARSLHVENLGGGAGNNYVYFATSSDGKDFHSTVRLLPGRFRTYTVDDGMVIISLMVWSSNANCRVDIDAAPGEWTLEQFREYVPYSIIQSLNETVQQKAILDAQGVSTSPSAEILL